MPSRCAVKGCCSTKSLHKIPPVNKFPLLHGQWLKSCDRDPTRPLCDIRVCSKHFQGSDFYDPYEKFKIKAGAVPSVNLGCHPTTTEGLTAESIDLVVDPLSPLSEYTVCLPKHNLELKINVKFDFANLNYQSNEVSQPDPANTRNPIRSTTQSIQNASNRIAANRLSQTSRKITKKYKTRCQNLIKARRNMKTAKEVKSLLKQATSQVHDFYKGRLRTIFTDNQIKKLVKNKRVRWTSEDIVRGLALRYQANFYDQLVSHKFPFPASRTLRRCTKKFAFPPGPPPASLLKLLKQLFGNASKLKKIAVMSVDEVGTDGRFVYDKTEDRIYAGKTNMTVFVIRGLFESWKQIIAYDFDGTVTVEKLTDLIAALENCGIEVRAITSDMGGKNMSLWKNLKIRVSKNKDNEVQIQNTIRSPINNSLIYFFADVPHLIKSLRNNLLNKGFTLDGGETLGLEDFKYMMSLDKTDLSSTWKLSDKHINVNDQQKQRVRLATELLSGTVATTFEDVLKRKREADFIRTVNDSFDVMNSRHLNETLGNKMPYGLSLPIQNATLNRMEREMTTLRVGDSKGLYPFQKGYLLTMKSFRDLFNELKEEHSIRYLLAHRLNQDILENIFSVLRGIGGFNMNPTAVDAKKRLKLIMLSATGTLSAAAVVKQDPDAAPFITGEMFSTLISGDEMSQGYEIDLPDDVIAEEYLSQADFNEELEEPRAKSQRLENLCEETGTQILAGYIAFKLKLPRMIASDEECLEFASLSWYKQLRRRGYAIPSREWQNQMKILDAEFARFHGATVSTRCGVMDGFSVALRKKYPQIDPEAVDRFCKIRTFIRIKSINKNSAAVKLQQKKSTAEKIQKLQDRWNQSKLLERRTSDALQGDIVSESASCDFSFLYDGDGFQWSNDILVTAERVFGHKEISKMQKTEINIAMSDLDCLLIMPTGSGKSLVYQLCACLSSGLTLVVSPLLSLIKDQTMYLAQRRINAIGYHGGSSTDDFAFPASNVKFLYCSPESLAKSRRLKEYLATVYAAGNLNRIVVDEAHCVLDWGKEFRTDYDAVFQLKNTFPTVPTLAVTATVTKDMERELCRAIGMPNGIVLRDPNYRENLCYSVELISTSEKNSTLLRLVLETFAESAGIVYCSTIKECETVCRVLIGAGVSAKSYHAKLTMDERNRIQESWYSGDHKVIVATTAFGMGVNKPDCRFVVHFTIPKCLIQYQQETGRAGRDGASAYCVTLITLQDVFRILSIVSLNDGGRDKFYEVLRYALSRNICRLSMLKHYFGHSISELEKCTHCDNCSELWSVIDVTIYASEIHKILEIAKPRKDKLTAKCLVDILMGKSRKTEYKDVIVFEDKSRTLVEGIVMFLLAENFVCEEFILAGRSCNCYVVKGARGVNSCISYTVKTTN